MKRPVVAVVLVFLVACSSSDATSPQLQPPRTTGPVQSLPNAHGLPRSFAMTARWSISADGDSALVLNDGDFLLRADGTFQRWTEFAVWNRNPVSGQLLAIRHLQRDTTVGTFTITTGSDTLFTAHAADSLGFVADTAAWSDKAPVANAIFPSTVAGWNGYRSRFPLEFREYTPQ